MLNKSPLFNPLLLFHVISVACLGIFIFWHGFTMGIAYDETYSFNLVKAHYFRAMPGSANTHWLNSFFMLILQSIFGDSPGWMRLHSMLAFPFFAHGIYRLMQYSRNNLLVFAGYCLVVFNPYILDFFALARGYGLAMTFQTWMLVYLVKAYSSATFSFRTWLYVLIMAALSIASNLTYVYGAIAALMAFAACVFYFYPRTYVFKQRKILLTAALFLLLIMLSFADLLFMKYYSRTLEYGGSNLIASVFESVVHRSLYYTTDVFTPGIIGYCTFIAVIAASAYGVIHAIRYKIPSPLLGAALILITIIAGNYLFNILFNSPYLYVRTAVQWYVPAIAAVIFALGMIRVPLKTGRIITTIFCLTTGAVMIVHCIRNANIYTCVEWRRTEDMYRCYNDLKKINAPAFIMHERFDGIYLNYYKITAIDPITIPFTLYRESQLNAPDSNLNALFKKDQYIMAYEPSLLTTYLQQNNIRFEVLHQYSYSGFKLIKVLP